MIPRKRPAPTLAQAIRRGTDILPGRLTGRYVDVDREASCPLGAAFLGSLPHGMADVQRFFTLARNSSEESICEFVLIGLMKAFPVLGLTVRVNDRLSQYLERERLVRRLPDETSRYDLTSHLSVYGAITLLHDKQEWSKDQVAGLMARCEL